jgi:Zn-dependent peptidase ImmA (M78 family)
VADQPFDPWRDIVRLGLPVHHVDLPPRIGGIYRVVDGTPTIGLNRSLTEREQRCILAEELGHHALQAVYAPQEFHYFRGRLAISKAERRAVQWAADRLIPLAALRHALCHGVADEAELCDCFDVTPDLLRFQLSRLRAAMPPVLDPAADVNSGRPPERIGV